MAEIWTDDIWPLAVILAKVLAMIVPVLLVAVYLTYGERKILAAIHLRRGPNVVGPFGLLQPVADGIKLFLKETVLPARADLAVFLLAPVVAFALALAAWAVIPVADGWVIADVNAGVLYLLAVSSLSATGVVMAGWSSNSKYSFLGGLRSAAQMVSYEVSIGFVVVCIILSAGSPNLSEIVRAQKGLWYVIPHVPIFVVFLVSMLAETNRAPFDLPEAESELVGGFNTEYSAMPFAMFFLGEYANMALMSAIGTLLFLGGWLPPMDVAPLNWIPGVVWFMLKVSALLFVFIWVRATFPRYRYDQLMRLGWKVFLPLSLAWVVVTAVVLYLAGPLAPQA